MNALPGFVIAVLLALLTGGAAQALNAADQSGFTAAQPLAAVQRQQHTLVVGSEQDYPPFATGMTDATAGGFTVELWKAVAAETELNYTIRVRPFHQLIREFREGRIDVLINLAASHERHQFADFTVPHVVVHGAIFVRRNAPNIRSEGDLGGKSIIVLNADLAHDYARSRGWGENLVLVDTAAEGLRLLASGKHDAMLLSKLAGLQTLRALDLTNVEALTVAAGFSQKFGFAVQRGQSELLGKLNEGLALTKSNGTYKALYEKWFGLFEVQEVGWRDLLKYISPLVVAFLVIAGYFLQRRQVERKQVEKKLHLAASVFTHAREGIMITAADGTIIDVNDAFTRITGYRRDEVLGQNPRLLSSGRQSMEFYANLWRSLIEQGHWYGEIWDRRKNGEVYAEMLTISAVRDAQGQTRQYVALFSDITALKEHEQKLEHIAHYDLLTNLPNRVLLADRLHQGMAQALRREQQLAVVFLDLDGFKLVNDRHGHDAGDQLLIAVAARMKQALREGDTLARIGGDEFVAVLLDLADIEASVPMLNRLLAAAAQPVQFGDCELQVSASLGVTFYPQADDIDADQLLRQADQAMYLAKLAGKNRYHFFSSGP